jgi:hypothetical protein
VRAGPGQEQRGCSTRSVQVHTLLRRSLDSSSVEGSARSSRSFSAPSSALAWPISEMTSSSSATFIWYLLACCTVADRTPRHRAVRWGCCSVREDANGMPLTTDNDPPCPAPAGRC